MTFVSRGCQSSLRSQLCLLQPKQLKETSFKARLWNLKLQIMSITEEFRIQLVAIINNRSTWKQEERKGTGKDPSAGRA